MSMVPKSCNVSPCWNGAPHITNEDLDARIFSDVSSARKKKIHKNPPGRNRSRWQPRKRMGWFPTQATNSLKSKKGRSFFIAKNIPKITVFLLKVVFGSFLVGEKPMALLLAIFLLIWTFRMWWSSRCRRRMTRLSRGGWIFGFSLRVRLGGGRALRMVTFYPFYWVFSKENGVFFCVILYIHFVTTELKLKDIQSQA